MKGWLKYNWWNKQTVICTCITQYTYTVHCIMRTRAQSDRRQHRRRTSEKSEMLTYKHVIEGVRIRCVNHQAKRVDSRAIVLLIATSVGALQFLDYQTNKHKYCWSNKQTKQMKLYTCHPASVYSWPLKSEHLIICEDIYKLWFCFEL